MEQSIITEPKENNHSTGSSSVGTLENVCGRIIILAFSHHHSSLYVADSSASSKLDWMEKRLKAQSKSRTRTRITLVRTLEFAFMEFALQIYFLEDGKPMTFV